MCVLKGGSEAASQDVQSQCILSLALLRAPTDLLTLSHRASDHRDLGAGKEGWHRKAAACRAVAAENNEHAGLWLQPVAASFTGLSALPGASVRSLVKCWDEATVLSLEILKCSLHLGFFFDKRFPRLFCVILAYSLFTHLSIAEDPVCFHIIHA